MSITQHRHKPATMMLMSSWSSKRIITRLFTFFTVVFVSQQQYCLVSARALTNTPPAWTLNSLTMDKKKRLVLVGGGHAHAQVIKALNIASRPEELHVTLIDIQKSASYSGMVPGCIAGAYTAEDTLLHLEPLTKWGGIEFVNDRVVDVDLEKNEIFLESSFDKPIAFDAISLDIGSASRGLLSTKGALEYSIPTRPISDLVKRFDKETDELKAKKVSQVDLVVIGGGAAGIELSMSVMGRWQPILGKDNIRVTLLDSGSQLVPNETPVNREALVRIMKEKGITIKHNCFVDEVQKDFLRLANGQEIGFTHCLWASGAESHDLTFRLRNRGLSVSERGWIRVNKYLQSVSHPYVFAAGDCNVMEGIPKGSPPKAGVYAVRSGPILIENLTKFLANEKPEESWKEYIPQDDFLKLLVCGDGTALGFRFGIPIHGKWVFQLKDAIDLSFMNLFKVENLPKLVKGKPYDTSQYDATQERRPPIDASEAAALLQRTDDDVDFQEAWDVIRDMADDETYRESVLQLVPIYEEGLV